MHKGIFKGVSPLNERTYEISLVSRLANRNLAGLEVISNERTLYYSSC